MPSVCCYFQVHQPLRLRTVSYFDRSAGPDYFDDAENARILRRVAEKCYLPANAKLLELIERHRGRFRVAFSISGIALEQMQRWTPEVIESFQRLARTGCVEFLAETYYHSLAALYNRDEFSRQVNMQASLTTRLFGQWPTAFRNTELIYDDEIGRMAALMGFRAVLTEGPDDVLAWRSPNYVYRVPGRTAGLLTKNYRLSDDVAFRFSERSWKEWPLSAEKYVSWIHRSSGNGEIVNLFMDYETFGEHQWETTGIFAFLDHFPAHVLGHPDWDFCTPTEAVRRYTPAIDLPFNRLTSWADEERDLSAWLGSGMQVRAMRDIFALGAQVKAAADDELTKVWRMLQTSDHFYYMCTKGFADGGVHAYFSPYGSPYQAFVNYQNVLRHFRSVLRDAGSMPLHVRSIETAIA